MKWSRDVDIAKRSMQTMLRAVSSQVGGQMRVPSPLIKEMRLPNFTIPTTPASSSFQAPGIEEIDEFGANPGRLRMLVYTPPGGVPSGAPLVVVLHGCGQGAAEFAQGSGWIALADELRLSLVMPEQSGRNNHGRCFQWFQPAQTGRGEGEALSIRQMVDSGIKLFQTDKQRVFVVGLSAGGAMTAALLAAYPDVFAGGAVVAGLPVGAAATGAQALMRMAHAGPKRTPDEWAAQVRGAAPPGYWRRWPRISIWHGASDTVVDPHNADLLATQWGTVHGLGLACDIDATIGAVRHRTWAGKGRTLMEQWSIKGMGHGYPIDGKSGEAAPYILDVNLPTTRRIAEFWSLA